MQHLESGVARRLFDLTEPISLVNFFSEEPNESMAALGLRNYWDGLLRGTLCTARPGPGRGGPRGLLQLRRR